MLNTQHRVHIIVRVYYVLLQGGRELIESSTFIIRHRKWIVGIFMILALIGGIVQFNVSVNYNMVDYLPENAPSTNALDLMAEEYAVPIPNANVMIQDVSIAEALIYKERLQSIEGISGVTWLDEIIDVKVPLEMANQDTVESYYKDGNALISLHIREGEEAVILDQIYELIGDDNAVSGDAVNTATSQKMAGNESLNAALILVPIIIIILILSTTSWVEPLFFLTAIGISILLNLGTNIFLGEVSFVTQSVAPILQLAVSLDYAIFLLHSFSYFRKRVPDPAEAMRLAMKQSFPAIASSAATTFFGFIALSFMEFGIGADLGVNLVKGIVFSFISVMVFLPALTLTFYKWIDRTEHRPIIPPFKKIGKSVLKLKIPSLILLFILIVPAFLAQKETTFIYGIGDQPENTRSGADKAAIEEVFGKNTMLVLLVPKGDVVKEEQLIQEMEKLSHVSSVISYVNMVSPIIPSDFLDSSITDQFYSDHYARMMIYTDVEQEGDLAFSLVENVQEKASSLYDEFHLIGESVTLYDMKNVVEKDNTLVNWLTIISIAFGLLVTFKSLSIPIVLLLTIQLAVWINLSVPYFMDTSLVYIGYLLISTIQLAATIDYGILLMDAYINLRKKMSAVMAIQTAINEKFFAILISASILSSVGFILWITSSNPIVSSIGILLGRGALLSFVLVMILLPALLVVFDRMIEKLTYKANFYKEK